jgi:hypothetical protein
LPHDGPYFKPANNIAKDRKILKDAEKMLKEVERQNADKLHLPDYQKKQQSKSPNK